MKTLVSKFGLLILWIFLVCTSYVKAQPEKLKNASYKKIAELQTQRQVEILKLNKEKAEQLKSVNLRYTKALEELRDKSPSRKKIEKFKTLNTTQNEEVREILNEKQFQAYLALKAKNRKRVRDRMIENRKQIKENRNAEIEKLELDKGQLKELRETKKRFAEMKKEIRAQRLKEAREEIKNVKEQEEEEIKSILNEQQYRAHLELVEERRKQLEKRVKEKRSRRN